MLLYSCLCRPLTTALRFCVVTLRLFATRGFAPTRAKPASASRRLGFCPRFAPSALLTTAQRFFYGSVSMTVILLAASPVSSLTISMILVASASPRPLDVEETTTLALSSLMKQMQSP